MPEGTERNVDQSRPDRGQLLWRQAAVGQGARTISLREDICLAHQPAQDIDIARRAQIEVGRKLAVPGIQFLVPEARQMRAGDPQDVSTMFGERAGTGRSSEDAGKVEDADARERPIAGWKGFGVAVADTYDLHERQRCHRSTLRMPRPFRLCSRHAPGALRGNDRLLEIGGVPSGNCARHSVAILRYAEHAECRGAMIGKIAMEIGPAPVPGRIYAHDGVSRG